MTWPPFVSGPLYARVDTALQAELVLMGDLAVTVCVLPLSLLPVTILAKK